MEPETLPLPLEDPVRYPAFWTRLGKTVALGFSHPLDFFGRIPAGESTWTPFLLVLLLSVPLYLFLCLYPVMLGFMGLMVRLGGESGPVPPFHWFALGCLGGIALTPLLQGVVILMSGLVNYGFLRLWGVHDPAIPVEQDLRAWVYAQAFVMLAFWTPIGPIAALGILIIAGMGFAHMHRVDTWRGIAAVLCPLILVGAVFLGALTAFFVVMASKDRREARNLPPQASRNLQDRISHYPSAILLSHVDQARETLNRLSREGQSPEATIDKALAVLPGLYPPGVNPYDPKGPAFRNGPPEALGEVGLEPLHDYAEPRSGHRFHAGVSVEAWTAEGRTRRLIQLDP